MHKKPYRDIIYIIFTHLDLFLEQKLSILLQAYVHVTKVSSDHKYFNWYYCQQRSTKDKRQ